MKIRIFSTTLALCFVLGMLFASCGNDSTNKGNVTDTAVSAYEETEKEIAPETEADTIETMPPESEPNEELRVPIENEKAISFIEFQYAKALEAISFAEGHLSHDYNTEMIDQDGRICYPITDSTEREELDGGYIDSFSDLSKYLRSIFARSIADDLIDIANECYEDVDGILCLKTDRIAGEDGVVTEDMAEKETEYAGSPSEGSETLTEEEPPAPVVSSREFFLSQFTDKVFRYTAKVTFEGVEEAEYFDFIFENTGSGWYWTQFPSLPG